MYMTEHEIFEQYKALRKTYDYLLSKKDEIKTYVNKAAFKSVTFIGCGSSYSLCKSGALSSKIRMDKPINAFAAGDLIINFDTYRSLLSDTLLIVLSRSGSTSEVIKAVGTIKKNFMTPCISICTCQNSLLSELADLNLEMPWAFDESVCQTRTVTNLYMADLVLIAIMTDDNGLLEELDAAVRQGEQYIQKYTSVIKNITNLNTWNKVVVLADSELEGIAEEGALAFNEICQLPSNYYHVLDVRHGPMVLIDDETLVIIAVSPMEIPLQKDLVRDMKQKGSFVVTVSTEAENIWGSDVNITVDRYKNFSVAGIPFIFIPQLLSYFKALAAGVNPDEPNGLHPWIKL